MGRIAFPSFCREKAEAKNTCCQSGLLEGKPVPYKFTKGCALPIYGITGYHHVICRLAQVKEKLQLISQYQLVL